MGLQSTMVLGMLVSAEALTIANTLPKPTVRGVRAYNGVNMEAPSPPPPTGRLGATVDQDGKSNVWAVEPTMNVEKENNGLMAFAPVAALAGLIVLCVPLLPILFAANPDQA